MLGSIEEVNIISSFHSQSKAYRKIQNRNSHGFIFRIKGSAEYNFGDKIISMKEGTVLFVPQGANYEYITSPENLYTSINFYAKVENPTPTLYSLADFYHTSFIFENFSELWRMSTLSDKYKCISVFYDFLSYIARIEHLNNLDKNKHYLIEPAIEYLKTHLFDCNLKIDNLHRLCLISDTYFRKIFLSRFSVTPQEYVITKRISHAKTIIDSGDYDSISQVAEQVGYKDPLYFSKAFKKIHGYSPSSINQ